MQNAKKKIIKKLKAQELQRRLEREELDRQRREKPLKIKKAINLIKKIVGFGKPQFGKIKYRKDENMKVYPNIKKALIKLKWAPKINLDRGIKIVINSFR